MTTPDRDLVTPKISYTPTSWKDSTVGGTAINAARLNNVETGLAQATQTVDAHDDRLDALEAAAIAYAAGQGTTTQGTTANRPAPGLGVYYFDTTLNKPIWGDGAGWRDAAGTALTGAGSSNAPQNFTAITQPDNSILCSWNAVAGATSYKLYEAQSPTGVAGATALTTTSSTRTPSTLRNYEYWVTATVSGVESAASNHATCSLPYVAPGGGTGGTGGGTTGSTPAQILNIGSGSTQNHFNVGIGFSTGHIDIGMPQIVSGYSNSPYFVPNATNDAVQFEVFANGGTTSSTTYHPRSELRELLADGTTKAAWTCASGKNHRMMGISTITHLPPDSEASGTPKPNVCYAQIHDAKGDVVRMQVETASGTVNNLRFMDYTHSPDGGASEVKTAGGSYTVGSEIHWMIDVVGTTCNLYRGGTISGTPGNYTYTGGSVVKSFTISGSNTFYFKAGDYQQFSTAVVNGGGNPDGGYQATSYARVEVKNLYVVHTPAL